MAPRKDEIAILFAMFLDLLGFGMLVSDIQLRAEKLMPAGWPKGPVIGILLGGTFLIQLFVSPWWGSVSDSRGRKPVAVFCTLLSAAAMLTYAFAGSIGLLFVSRIISGLGAANVAVAQAFISDRYEAKQRTAALGRIGAAISTGLVVGPPLGGTLAKVGEHLIPNSGLPQQFLLGIVAGTASLIGAIAMWLTLPNVPPQSERKPDRKMILDFRLLRDFPHLRPLATIAVVAWLSLATLEGTFARLLKHLFNYDQVQFGWIFGYESLLMIVIQGTLLVWLAKRWRDMPMLRTAYLLQGAGLALNPASAIFSPAIHPLVTLFVASTLYAFGSGVANPTINSLCSRLVPDERQGELFGLLQGTRSVGFVLGPLAGGALFDWQPAAPYIFAGLVCLAAAFLVPEVSGAPTGPVSDGV